MNQEDKGNLNRSTTGSNIESIIKSLSRQAQWLTPVITVTQGQKSGRLWFKSRPDKKKRLARPNISINNPGVVVCTCGHSYTESQK
jgi:hypothetical protein